MRDDCQVVRQVYTVWTGVMPAPAGPPCRLLDGLCLVDLMQAFELLGELCAEHNTGYPDSVVECGCGFCTPSSGLFNEEVQMCSKSPDNGAAGGSGGGSGVVGGRGKPPTSVMRGDGGGCGTGGLANPSGSLKVM